jgi:ribosome-associated heat shock protein Hsp15
MSASSDDDTGPGAARLDRWLFAVRLFKSRSLAAEAAAGGKVHLNGERVKPSREVRPGDTVTFVRSAVEFECTVTQVPLRRGPATAAAQCYEESEASKARRAVHAERMRLAAAHASRPAERPDKHQRQQLRRLRGRQ